MKRWRTTPSRLSVFWLVGALCIMVAAAGCGTTVGYLRLPAEERRLFEIYSGFMTDSQQAEYLGGATPTDREAYAESLGVRQRFLALSEAEREAVLEQRLEHGMSADALLMSWGHPAYRFGVGKDAEEWVYSPNFSRHLPPSACYEIYLEAGRVSEWRHFIIRTASESASRAAAAIRRPGRCR